MPCGHQIPTTVLTGPHQIPGRLLSHAGDRHLYNLAQVQQPGQMSRIPGVGLHPIPGRSLQFRRRSTRQSIPASINARARPNPVGPAS